jgi:long-chain fatty acid transport protein
MLSTKLKVIMLSATALMASSFAFQSAEATNGYFSNGYGTAAKGMSGASVAAPQDTQAAVNNPAGMRALGDRVDGGLALFSPIREFNATSNQTFIADFEEKSKSNIFFIPSLGASWDMGDYSLGLTMSANGGMNTDYATTVFAGGTSGKTGIDLMQAFIGATYARDIGDTHTFGITPTFAVQRFSATGLQGFANISTDSTKLSDNGHDYSYGGGVRIGWLTKVSDKVTLGFSGQSRMYMTKFDKYAGLFAEKGGFDIPGSVTFGGSIKATDKLTVNADVQRIFYNSVKSISNGLPSVLPFHNSFNADTRQSLGGTDGVGFGWQDMNIIKLGAQYVYSDTLTLRAGASHNSDAFKGTETLFNILAPAVVDTHLSVGATYSTTPTMSWNFSFTHAFASDITGANVNHATVTTLGSDGTSRPIKLEMYQNEVEVGFSYNF